MLILNVFQLIILLQLFVGNNEFLQSVDVEYGPSGFGIGNGTLSNYLGDSIHLTNLLRQNMTFI